MRICYKIILAAFFIWHADQPTVGAVGPVADEPVVYISFDDEPNLGLQNKNTSYKTGLSSYCEGISGRALDLSEDVALRRPVIIDGEGADFDTDGSFSIQLWVKTRHGAVTGMPIAGNKKSDQKKERGWIIDSQTNGAWALHFSDSNAVYDYMPTGKQRINDGAWHQVVWVVDAAKEKATMYFDGSNVAIYNVKGLGPLFTESSVVIGGTEEYGEYGSNYEWKSFNGMIDEVKIWNRSITGDEVSDLFRTFQSTVVRVQKPINRLKVLAWNIWHGGRRTGEVVGVQRTVELIRSAKIDIVCMQETYGSGAIIADSLGFYFYLISSNLSIMSRYPIVEVYDIYKPFNSGSAMIRLSDEQDIKVFCIWLHYLPNYTKHVREKSHTANQLIQEEGKTRHAEVRQILKEAKPFIDEAEEVPVLMCGDFNSGSHLDWVERTRQLHNGYMVQWPVSTEMSDAGMIDSYRQSHPDPLLYPGITWTPRASTKTFADGSLDRIDYIYYKGSDMEVIRSEVMDYHPIQFPSDHAGVITTFMLK